MRLKSFSETPIPDKSTKINECVHLQFEVGYNHTR